MPITDDPADPCINEVDAETGLQACYLVLSEAERAQGFIRPVRHEYVHVPCGTVTTMHPSISETYARDPYFYGATYCAACRTHRPVGPAGEFVWASPREGTPLGETDKVGT